MKKANELLNEVGEEVIFLSAELQVKAAGKRNSATLIKELCVASPRRGSMLKKTRLANKCPKMHSPEIALALMIDTHLSTHQYRNIREYCMDTGNKIYPSYNTVYSAKLACYPKDISVTESCAEIKLQSLIDHTVSRLCIAEKNALNDHIENLYDVNIIIKWGCDGSQQNRYKQSFSSGNCSDENLFAISLVPIQMYNVSNSQEKTILWQNPVPSSTKYCRPIKFVFTKETPETIKKEVDHINSEIAALIPTEIIVNDINLKVKTTLILCMVDGKVCNALSNYTSSQTCYICGATPKSMNIPNSFRENVIDHNMLSVGLSILHSYIRFMECILHISYRLEIKRWQASGKFKEIVAERKLQIQARFKNETGLLIDMPKQNSGNTNDGNTARRFFKDPEKTSDITGIDIRLINRFRTILEALSSGLPINSYSFQKYTDETASLYLLLYPWYYMPASVHKVLYHGTDIISSCILPIGQLSEEAQEARNKDIRRYRECFTRKTSRIHTNSDLIKRLLISSDPYISSLRKPLKKCKRDLSNDVLSLLSIPHLDGSDDENQSIYSSDSE